MPRTRPKSTPRPPRSSSPGRWLGQARTAWSRSLQFRATLVIVVATAIAITVVCVGTALAIRNDLFTSRVDQALAQAQRAVEQAQDVIDSADRANDRATLQQIVFDAREELKRQGGTNIIAYYRIDDGPSEIAPPDYALALSGGDAILTDGLRDRVRSTAGLQWWQSVPLRVDANESSVPGVLIGQQLRVQNAGTYEVYLAYSFADTDETLRFVQGTLWITGIALVLVIAAISWFVLRTVSAPIIEASRTSARFASGDLEVRMPVRGQDELATLGSSFNAMAESIRSQITELGELSQVQQRFVSDVSHELRTPLTTIRLAAEMLNDRRDEFDEFTARSAELLYTQVVRFEELLSDLLEISRYDAGSVQLEREAVNLAQLCEEEADAMRQVAEAHGIDLRVVAPGGYSPVDVDPRRVRRILRNLIGNAIEHGEHQPVVITVDSDSDAVAVGVRDWGMGMRPEHVERVFDRFWRADPSRKRTLGGTGLGLAIALGDARLHRGRLEVWSELGRGTNFVLTLPRSTDRLVTRSPIPLEPDQRGADLGVTAPIRTTEEEPS